MIIELNKRLFDIIMWNITCRKDVRLPVHLQRAMATEAEAAREARAKVIAAEGEQKASNALMEAANVIQQSPHALQVYQQYNNASFSLKKLKMVHLNACPF